MTIEEAKKFFGEKIITPNLQWFNEKNISGPKDSKAKKGKKYWYYYTSGETHFVEQFGKFQGWVLGTVVFRRHGIAFLKFEGSRDKNFQVEFFDGAYNTQKLVPEIISAKEYKINKDIFFAFKDLEGRVKFID